MNKEIELKKIIDEKNNEITLIQSLGKRAEDFNLAISIAEHAHREAKSKLEAVRDSKIAQKLSTAMNKLNEEKLKFSQFLEKHRESLSVTNVAQARGILKTTWLDLLVWSILILEGAYGYYVTKTYIFPDTDLSSYLSSMVVGALICFISVLLKKLAILADFLKPLYATLASVFLVLFLYSVVVSRNHMTEVGTAESVEQLANSNIETLFQMGLLGTLIFGSAILSILNRSPNEEKDSLIIIKASQPIEELEQRIANLESANQNIQVEIQKIEKLQHRDLVGIAKREYLNGAKSFPSTYKKRQAIKRISQFRGMIDLNNELGTIPSNNLKYIEGAV